MSGVTVRVRGEDMDTSGYTDEKGVFKLPYALKATRGVGVQASLETYAPVAFTWTTSPQEATPPATVAITLEKTVPIGGVVVDQNGKPLAGAKVMILPAKKYANGSPVVL